ncbi:putative aminopeptidase-2 [Polistes fuscatus]|uniref:putative aminopeptidase-2 n=1 Tax=Polistes fuscatus TaxID=30207 RepID=UPI001CA9475A|nr:putative aminopeptidase-2 [Polistes fuscatus]
MVLYQKLVLMFFIIISKSLDESQTYDDLASKDYRLPNSMHPTSYEINLFPKLIGDFSFRGEVKINVTVDEPTKLIVLHYGSIFNVKSSVSAENTKLDIEDASYDNETEKYSILLKESLKKGDKIVLTLTYDSYLRNDMIGFYKSSYITDDNLIKWLAATQFETTHARHAFPCFDEPGYKATFKISLTRSKEFISISNMPLENTQEISSDLYQDNFKTTVPMSTYLVAFAIFDFAKNSSETLTVWARPDMIDQSRYALKIGSNALAYLQKLFDQPYELPKMDMVAIPDFSAGAMENWGLITYRESRMLYDEKECSVVAQQNVASVIIHEITHMWFGNLLTPSWWSYLWLSEGFARYFQYFGTAKIENTWNMEGQFLVEQHLAALGVDGIEESQSMTRIVNNRSQIAGIADSITYAKGASVIRMMSHFIGINKFHEALRLYVRDSKTNGIVKPENLWLAFQNTAGNSDIVIETIMNNWTKEPGFPVLSVTIEKGKATLKQHRFLLRNLKSTPVNTNWWIPITYTTKKQTNFVSTEVKHWMKNENEIISIDASDSDWVIFNVQQTGFYRVNYDNASWYRIIDELNSSNFTKIHEYNRAGIIDDLLNLARAGLLDYRIALDGLQYLRQEKNYLPFKAAFRGLDYLTQRFSGDEANYVLYKKYVLSLIENVYRGLGYVDRKNDDRLTVQLRRELNDLACKFDHKECVSNSLEFFRNWINATSRNRIEPNQRSAAYCTGILHGNLDDWKLLWNHYKTSKVVSEQVVVLNALGCSRNIDILEQYLRCAISPYEVYRIRKQDSTSVFSAIYSSSVIGINTVLDFVDKNHDAMAKYYDGYDTIASILSGLSRYLSTDELINKFERLIKKHTEFSKITKSLMSSLELAKYELNWYKNNVDRIISRINDNNHKSDDPIIDEYRLPNNVIPQKYILSLEPFLVPDNFTFNGNVQIVASVVKKTNKIVLHASNITVHSVNVMVNNEEVNVTESYESIYDFFVIKLENALNEKTEVNIIFRYTGNLNNAMLGFYKSYYIDSDGKQRWLATTQMEPVGARKMFPCFDEPAMKAVFTVEVLIPDSYHAISNTKPREIKKDTDKTLYRFEDTELMSTYLLALVVSDFNHVHHEGEKNYKIWFRPNSFNETSYSLSLMEPLVKTYEELLQHNYTLDKLDMIALPDLSFGAMENWGLLTFREQYLLLQSEETNIRDIQTGTNIISHEIAHQWFGNLVTPLWWKYAWLNEGFATYFEYFGTSHIKPEWELEYQFVVNELHSAFKRDALTSSHPMSYDVSTPTEIGDIFDKITYAKAGSVIRMIEKTYGSDVFYAALQNYLEERKYNVATPEDLYKAISNQLADETSANGVSKFLNSWTTQAGFPVVNVTIDSDGLATLSQERFFLRNENGESVENIWEIPITWTSEKNPNFNNTKPQFWLNQIEMKIMTDNSEGWKIFNIQQAGYYRVNYDIANWKRIIDALTQQKFEKIHKVNRAALIDDLMNLARVGYVDYDLLFSATEYLKYENEYLPWRAFFNGLTYLHNKFEAQEIFESLKQHVLKLINSIIEKSLNKESQLSDLLLMELHKWACKYQSKYCYEMMRSPNTRPGIYCEKARTSYMWNDIWKAYINSTITSEKRVILKALGCTEHTYLINTLLNRAISENSGIRYGDSIGVFASVYENSQIGVKSVLRYMIMAFDNIYNYYEDESAIKNIMGGLAERISTEKLYEQYRYVTDFLISKVPTLNNTLQSYNDLIIYELNWYKKNIPKISYWLEKLYPLKNNNRLPTTLYPLNYNLSIAIRNNMLLEGSVKINIRVDKPAFKIVLNSYELDIVPTVIVYETPIGTSDKDLKYFDILGYELISENQQLIIYLTTHIEVPKVTVEIGFYKVDISDKEMKGLYRGRYINNNEYHTYFATYFQPNYARMVFPCFDEPAFKAKFKIHILRDKSYKTLSNMPLERSFPNDTQYTWDIYKESLNMSTYLLGFVVSNFVPIKNDKEKFNIWGREEIIQYGDEVQYAAYKYYKSINQIFVQEDESEKIDFVGLPNFPIGAMENWGLFTFRESQLFYDKDIIPLSRRYSILTTVSHEISHKYFGNLVTCEWWSYTWLNEGFAQYFQWLLLEVFGVDGFIYSHPLNYPVSDPKDLRKPFDIISYKKVNPEKLWNEIDGYIRNDHNLEETMNEWVNKPGYPVVSISYDKYNKKIRITQQRFLYYAYDGPSRFHIPISIATEENPNFYNTKPQFWLRTTENTFDFDLEDQWIVFNIQQLGYYRVNYDNTLMTRLINILNSNKYSTIHVINRAQIIDDAFNLARASNTYSKALKLALYLRREKEHLPWKAFGRGINNLWEHIRHSGKIEALQRYVLYLTNEHVERLGFIDYYDDSDKLGNLSKNNQLNRELILSLNCKFGGKTCIDESTKIFKSTEQFKTIPRNAKPAILCTGIKHTDHNNWSKLWSAYTETKLHSEQILYLDALGCSEDDMTLNKYLKYIFNENALKLIRKEDIPRAFASIYTSSDIGWKKCYEYLINHYVEIYDLLNNRNDVGALFYEIVIRIPDIETLDKFKFFMQNNEENLAPITATLLEATEIAEKLISTNQQLPSQIQSILQDILYQIKHEKNSNGNSGASNLNIVFLTIVSLISLLLFK